MSSAMAALEVLVRYFAVTVASRGITVNAMSPVPIPIRQNYAWLPEPTREQMVGRALRVAQWHGHVEPVQAQKQLEDHFDDLFMYDATGYRPRWPDTVRELLITWERGR